MQWSLQQLLTFRTVAEMRSMTSAAKRLGYTTGAVSQQITQLEASVGSPLFTRMPRVLLMTATGENFLSATAPIIDAYQRAQALVEQPDLTRPLVLKLGVFTSAAVAYLPSVLDRLAEQSAHITVESTEVSLHSAVPSLMNGTIDLSLTVTYPNIPSQSYDGTTSKLIDREPFFLLTRGDEPVTRETLNELPWILPPDDTLFGKSVRQSLHGQGISPRITHTLENHVAAISLAQAGLGVTTVTRTTMALTSGQGHLHPFPGEASREIILQTLTGVSNRPSIQTLSTVIAGVVAESNT